MTHLSLSRLLVAKILGSECVCAAFAEMGKKVNCEIVKKGQLDKLEQTYRGEWPITIPDPIRWSFLPGLKSTQCLGEISIHMF